MALGGVGLTFSNTMGVIRSAGWRTKAPFARTPKYRVKKKGETSQAKVYRKRLGIMPWIELSDRVTYFAWTVWYAISTENYFTVPFLVLFVFGLLVYRAAESAAGSLRTKRGFWAADAREALSCRCLRWRV